MIHILVPLAALIGWIVGVRQGWVDGFAKAESLVRLKLGWLMDDDREGP